MKTLLKIIFLPLLLPLYIMWVSLGRLLGGRRQVYDVWRW